MEHLTQFKVIGLYFDTKIISPSGEEVKKRFEHGTVLSTNLRVRNNGGYTYTGEYIEDGVEYVIIITYKDIRDRLVQQIAGGGRKRRKTRKLKRRHTRKN